MAEFGSTQDMPIPFWTKSNPFYSERLPLGKIDKIPKQRRLPMTIDTAKIEKLEKICPELADLYDRNKYLRRGRAYKTAHDKIIEAIVRQFLDQQEKIEGLREFTQYALDLHSWDNEPNGGDLQDKAEELKLIELRPIEPEDAIMDETEQYFCVWTPEAARQGERE